MKVMIVTPGYPPMLGGCERQAQTLGRELTTLGHDVTIVAGSTHTESDFWEGNPASSETTEGGINLLRYPIVPMPGGHSGLLIRRKLMVMLSQLPGTTGRLIRMSRRFPGVQFPRHAPSRPDIIHSINISWEHGMMTAWRWAAELGVPHVAAPSTHFGNTSRSRVAQNSMMRHQRMMLGTASAVLTMTDREETGFHAWGVYPRLVVVTGNGVDAPPPFNETDALRAQHQIDGDYLLFIGRTTFDKGAVGAAEAVLNLNQTGVPVTLVMIGRRTLEFDRWYERLDGDQRKIIRHLGMVDHVEKHALLDGCSALLLPSRSESFGMVILEAWSHSRPVIGANSGGIPGLMRDGVDGILVPFGDVNALSQASRRLLTNDTFARLLGKNGRDRVSDYTWPSVARKVDKVYKQLTRQQADYQRSPGIWFD